VLLLGVPLGGRGEQALRDEARAYGAQDRFDLLARPSRADILRGLCRARASLIFSRLEGSCIAVAESLLADTPVGLFRTARIGSKTFINERTGRLLDRGLGLPGQIERLVEEADDFDPRAWAMAHISCYQSQRILNTMLREDALRRGLPWTRGVWPMRNDLLPGYPAAEDEAEARPWIDDFARRYGLQIGAAAEPARPAAVAEAVA
jgi:hypothetical protein